MLHLPHATGHFILYSDTSIGCTSSSLWQVQEGKPQLIGYASKTFPEACALYSVTELEMTGLLVNIGMWKISLNTGNLMLLLTKQLSPKSSRPKLNQPPPELCIYLTDYPLIVLTFTMSKVET